MTVVCLLAIFFVLMRLGSAFVPAPCARQLSLAPIRGSAVAPIPCCPDNCGGPQRGACVAVSLALPEKDFLGLPAGSPLLADDRLDWPTRFFSHLCRCRGRRSGPACELCQPGWSGPACQRRDRPLVRRNLSSLSGEERRKLQRLMLLSRSSSAAVPDYALLVEDSAGTLSSSDPLRRPRFLYGQALHFYLVHLHFYAQRGTMSVPEEQCETSRLHFNFNHQGNNFLPWHRYFLVVWERALRRLAIEQLNWPQFGLPYWDWTDSRSCGLVCSEDLFGLRSDKSDRQSSNATSAFGHWEELCASQFGRETACFGCMDRRGGKQRSRTLSRTWMAGHFPSRAEVLFAASRPRYYQRNDLACRSLVMALEGECGPGGLTARFFMHNRLHALVNGSFSHGATSPNDPIFPLHHAQIDRILESWLSKYGHSRAVLQLPDMHRDRPGHGPESYLVGFVPLVKAKDVLVPTEALGYTYDTLEL